MKAAVIGICCVLTFIFVNLINVSITDEATRVGEIEDVLETGILYAMEEMRKLDTYDINSVEEFMSDFNYHLLSGSSANCTYRASLYGIDEAQGCAYIEVKSIFKIANGKDKTITKYIAVDFEEW